ncbi:MAG TPA: response regulator [Candidatus Limnocylindria bacterium]|nr:response regulator [Candidatus Limnocylindria bacterium]
MNSVQSVWVVDDEPLIRTAIVAVLEDRGFQSAGFGSAAELYTALVDGGEPDLIILDQMLPDESGSTIVRSLREREEYRDIPVLFLTAVSDIEAERLSDLAPVLGKPFDFRDLMQMVDELVSVQEAR